MPGNLFKLPSHQVRKHITKAGWDESKHPRDQEGQFSSGGGGGSNSSSKPKGRSALQTAWDYGKWPLATGLAVASPFVGMAAGRAVSRALMPVGHMGRAKPMSPNAFHSPRVDPNADPATRFFQAAAIQRAGRKTVNVKPIKPSGPAIGSRRK